MNHCYLPPQKKPNNIQISSGVVKTMDGYIPVLLANPTNKSSKITAGTRVGVYTHVQVHDKQDQPVFAQPHSKAHFEHGRTHGVSRVKQQDLQNGTDWPVNPQAQNRDHILPLLNDTNCDLNQVDIEEINDLLREYADVFHDPGQVLPPSKLPEVSIQLKENAYRFHRPAYRLNPSMTTELRKIIDYQVGIGLLQPITSGAWGSSCLLVKNRNNTHLTQINIE